MFQQSRETSYLESTSLLVQVFRWRKPLLIITCIGAIASFIFSGPAFITPKFKASVVFFPPATNSLSKSLLDENRSDKQDILAFGAEEEAEQLLQLLNSDAIRDAIISKYRLMEHYAIDASESYPATRLNEEYRDNISFSRTEFMSVRIDVLDKDPVTAAGIANDIASLLDSTKNNIRRARAEEAVMLLESAYHEKEAAVSHLEDSLSQIRRKGVMDYATEAAIWSEQYARSSSVLNTEKAALAVLERSGNHSVDDTAILHTRARIEGAVATIQALDRKLAVLAELGGPSVSLTERLTFERKEIARLQEQLEKLRMDANHGISGKFIVNKASVPERKSTPVRWLIVLLTTFGCFTFTLISLLFLDRIRNLQR